MGLRAVTLISYVLLGKGLLGCEVKAVTLTISGLSGEGITLTG